MKKSNIYLLSILCSVTLFIILGALVSVARGKKSSYDNSSNSSVPAYSHIVLKNTNYDVEVKTGDKYEMKIRFNREEEKFEIPFNVRQDTLFLSKLPSDLVDKIKAIELNIPIDNLDIKAQKSRIDLNSYLGKSLKIELDQAESNIYKSSENGFSFINIQCINKSKFYSRSKCDRLQLDVRDSDFENWGAVGNITGSVKDKSSVMINEPGETKLEKDKESKVQYFYN
ncbi:hypothetical protein EI427_17780 [Flammeovirga pectinis]|uniref:Uncharacterized protein n=1 Tax=Flammeovirga pectinis TaxID=2494373 RepID=A0A3Q9FR28_9BACT|nr:hypothetical protein [Flammeovirga pectinis]AZQ64008.1 hypothetical protein EI427_17780 [Flammeovirga pectinis]